MRHIAIISLLAYFLATAAATAAQDPAQYATSVVDNDHVRVTEITLKPGQQPPAVTRDDVPLVIVTLRARAGASSASDSSAPPEWSFVRVQYMIAPVKVNMERTRGMGVLRQVWIKLKAAPPTAPFDKDAVKLDPAHNRVVLENGRVRIVDLQFPAGSSGPLVDKRARVIVMLTNSHAIVTRPDGKEAVRDGEAGRVAYSGAGSQATLNAGKNTLENIVVELKSE